MFLILNVVLNLVKIFIFIYSIFSDSHSVILFLSYTLLKKYGRYWLEDIDAGRKRLRMKITLTVIILLQLRGPTSYFLIL